MRQELDDLLCQRYPEIFCDRQKDQYETSMCWGFCCGDGWFDIINGLCAVIDTEVSAGKMPPVVARQVKEKMGSLRFRIHGGNEKTRQLIELARQNSEHTCEECGQPAELRALEFGRVLCTSCADAKQPAMRSVQRE
jgi:hypothetical protein